MNPTKKAAVQPTAHTNTEQKKVYHTKRQTAIEKRLADMPERYRATYARAVLGKSLRAGTKSFCLECTGWLKDEVRLCTALACPLYSYRPYRDKMAQDFMPSAKKRDFSIAESMNSKGMDLSRGESV